MGSSDWSTGIRYHIFDIRPDTEFKLNKGTILRPWFGGCSAILRAAIRPCLVVPRSIKTSAGDASANTLAYLDLDGCGAGAYTRPLLGST